MDSSLDKKEFSSKVKLLKIYELLRAETDINHPISRNDLCKRLNEDGISSNVRTLSQDIEVLNEYGFEVLSVHKGHEKCYYIPEFDFSIPEVKILMDAVQAASFITENKTKDLIEKVSKLAGVAGGELLLKNTVKFNSRKHTNEQILYSVDRLGEAIEKRQQVSFTYFDLDEFGKRSFRLDEKGKKRKYQTEPVALVYNEDNYYLVTFNSKYPTTTVNYRVDRMENVVVEKQSISEEALGKVNGLTDFMGQAFKMYNGELVEVKLKFEKSLIGVVYDKFGERIELKPEGKGFFSTKVQIRKSPVFYGWVFQFGGKMKILSPKVCLEEYDAMKKA